MPQWIIVLRAGSCLTFGVPGTRLPTVQAPKIPQHSYSAHADLFSDKQFGFFKPFLIQKPPKKTLNREGKDTLLLNARQGCQKIHIHPTWHTASHLQLCNCTLCTLCHCNCTLCTLWYILYFLFSVYKIRFVSFIYRHTYIFIHNKHICTNNYILTFIFIL